MTETLAYSPAHTVRAHVLVAAITLLSACGGDSPTAPTPQPPVIPSITGQWTGRYTVTSCAENGIAIGGCGVLGSGGSHIFTPQQSGSSLSGNLSLGGVVVPVNGNIGADNIVSLSGTATQPNAIVLAITTWRATVSGSTMTGTMNFTLSTSAPFGSVVVQSTFSITR